jgi:hypothetical protein
VLCIWAYSLYRICKNPSWSFSELFNILVYILYLDESGLDTESEYFILSGFALHDKQWNRFQDSMASVKDNIKN